MISARKKLGGSVKRIANGKKMSDKIEREKERERERERDNEKATFINYIIKN